jgi:hypothetical protein
MNNKYKCKPVPKRVGWETMADKWPVAVGHWPVAGAGGWCRWLVPMADG